MSQIKQMSNFYPLVVVGRCSETQLQVGENLQAWIFKPEFTIVIFIHYKLRIATAFLDL